MQTVVLLEARDVGSNSARITDSFEPPDMDIGKLELSIIQGN